LEKEIKLYNKTLWSGKRYNFFGDYLRNKYECRILKLPINADFTCPNRDGKLGRGGCIFCCEEGSASPTTHGIKDIISQMDSARVSFKRSDSETRYIAYFQAFTNTYAQVKKLKLYYDTAIKGNDISGLMIGTRPDCLAEDVLDLIASYKKENFELWLEIGIQTVHNRSLEFLRRKHTWECSRDAIMRAAAKGIPVCIHVILGIPGETWEDMMETARILSSLPVSGIKIHHLHVIMNTPLHKLFLRDKMHLLSLKEYISTVCDFIERLRPDIILHRLSGDRNEKTLIAPAWGMHKGTVLNSIDREFEKRTTYQGFLFNQGL